MNNASFTDTRLEDAIIGQCLIEDCFGKLVERSITEEYFAQYQARSLFSIMESLNREGQHIDLITVSGKVREGNDPSLLQYAVSTTSTVYNASHILSHLDNLTELYFKREVNSLGLQLVESVRSEEQQNLLERIRSLTETLRDRMHSDESTEISDFVMKSREAFIRRNERRMNGIMDGVTTGLSRLDDITGGWCKTRLTVFAGRPGMGKTALAVHFALSAAKAGHSVAIHSLEMGGVELTDRMVCAVSDIDTNRYRHGDMDARDVSEFDNADRVLSSLPITIDPSPIQSVSYIWASAKRLKDKGKCDLLIVDYLQLVDMTSGANKNLSKEQLVSKASREFKLMAKDLDIPVILLSQLNRAVEGRSSKRPELSDLRDSGSIEQDADNVIFVYRPEYYEEEGEQGETVICGFRNDGEIIIRKHRNGPCTTVSFSYNESLTKIRDASSDYSSLHPEEESKLPY